MLACRSPSPARSMLGIGVVFLVFGLSAERSCASTVASHCLASLDRGHLVITAMSHKEDVSPKFGKPFPIELTGIEVWEDDVARGHMVWAVDVKGDAALVRTINYGQVPTGYAQRFPIRDKPPALREGFTYGIVCGMGRGRFKYGKGKVENLDAE